jgi:hypothetical protein
MQRYRLPLVVAVGLVAVVAMLAMAGNGGTTTSRAEEGPALLQMPDFPPTPTVPPAPVAGPSLQSANTLFADSFSSDASLANWQIMDIGEVIPGEESVWRVVDGRFLQDRTARAYNPDFRDTIALTGEESWSNYTISANVYDAANAVVGLVVRQQGESFYRFRWFVSGTEGDRKLVLEKVVDGQVTELAGAAGPGYEHYRWYNVSLSANGSQLTVKIDGAVVLEANDTSISTGRAGVTTTAFGTVNFDDVTVTAP